MSRPRSHLYLDAARTLAGMIDAEILQADDRLPSLREFSRQRGISLATSVLAYRWLEDQGLITPRAGSGYYVCRRPSGAPADASGLPPRHRKAHHGLWLGSIETGTPQGFATPAPEFFPRARLSRIIGSMARRHPQLIADYGFGPGELALRRQIARRALEAGCTLSASDILVTSGGMEAMGLALRAVTVPGDGVIVESPCNFGTLQLLRQLRLRPIEVRAEPETGIALDGLEQALHGSGASACVLMSNCAHPLGYVLPDERKQALVEILASRRIPLVENDVLGDLAYEGRPRVAKAFDGEGNVLLCSSFTKSLGPGLRVGWIAPGRYMGKVSGLKFSSTIATSTLMQRAVAEYLRGSAFERHLRALRRTLKRQTRQMAAAVKRHFPPASTMTCPAGGYVLWVELPAGIDTADLSEAGHELGLDLLPGALFSEDARFSHCLRLSCGEPWSPRLGEAIHALGRRIVAMQRLTALRPAAARATDR